jgi:sugar phosphate isomerase/epimerase
MTISRRNFLVSSSMAALGTMILPKYVSALGNTNKIVTGIQLYSVRDDMKANPLQTLQQLASMGYTQVEHANYVDRKFYGYSAKAFKKILSNLGMNMPSGHIDLKPEHWDAAKKDFTKEWKHTIEDAAIVGQQYVISPWLDDSMRTNIDQLKNYMEVFNKCGQLCKRWGLKYGYHNHDFEFKEITPGTTIYDVILQNTDPALVTKHLDIGNLYNGNATVMPILNKYQGRFASMHVKNEILSSGGNEHYESSLLNNGVVPVKEAIDYGKDKGGTHLFIIEQESYQGKAPLDCAKENLAIMKTWGY